MLNSRVNFRRSMTYLRFHAYTSLGVFETGSSPNIVGLTYDLLGLLILSEIVAKSERLTAFVVRWVAGAVLWGQTIVPLGAALGAWLHSAGPSSAAASAFLISFWCYSLFLLALIDSTVFFPRIERLQDISLRSRVFGLILLVSGVAVQLIAAFKDFYV